jgi:hypothetical protein
MVFPAPKIDQGPWRYEPPLLVALFLPLVHKTSTYCKFTHRGDGSQPLFVIFILAIVDTPP